MSTALTIVITVGALSALCCLALLLMVLVSPGRPERNQVGWALRHENEPVPYLPLTDDELADWTDLARRLGDES